MLRGLRIVAPCVAAVTALAGCAGKRGTRARRERPARSNVGVSAAGTADSDPDSAAGVMERLIRRRGLPVPELMGRARIDDRDPHVTEASPTSVVVTYLPLEAFAGGANVARVQDRGDVRCASRVRVVVGRGVVRCHRQRRTLSQRVGFAARAVLGTTIQCDAQ